MDPMGIWMELKKETGWFWQRPHSYSCSSVVAAVVLFLFRFSPWCSISRNLGSRNLDILSVNVQKKTVIWKRQDRASIWLSGVLLEKPTQFIGQSFKYIFIFSVFLKDIDWLQKQNNVYIYIYVYMCHVYKFIGVLPNAKNTPRLKKQASGFTARVGSWYCGNSCPKVEAYSWEALQWWSNKNLQRHEQPGVIKKYVLTSNDQSMSWSIHDTCSIHDGFGGSSEITEAKHRMHRRSKHGGACVWAM